MKKIEEKVNKIYEKRSKRKIKEIDNSKEEKVIAKIIGGLNKEIIYG